MFKSKLSNLFIVINFAYIKKSSHHKTSASYPAIHKICISPLRYPQKNANRSQKATDAMAVSHGTANFNNFIVPRNFFRQKISADSFRNNLLFGKLHLACD